MSRRRALITGASAGLGEELALEAVERGRPIQESGRLYRRLDPLAPSVWLLPLLESLAPGR